MIRVVIMYPKTSDSHFDMNYYLENHLPLIREIFKDLSLMKIEVDEGVANASFPREPVPYASISYFHFVKIFDFQAGMVSRGHEMIADMLNYTNVQPQIQVNWITAR